MHLPKKKYRTSGKEYLKKKSNTLKKLSESKTGASRTPVWNGAQYMKRRSQRY
jgi:hypothetical protein